MPKAKDGPIKISPSSLSLYRECPRCFWLQFNEGIKRPSGPMSTLPNGVDYTLKNYFDHWRKDGGHPPLLHDKLRKIGARLLDNEALIAKFRSRSFGIFDTKVGARTDCPLKHKRTSAKPALANKISKNTAHYRGVFFGFFHVDY